MKYIDCFLHEDLLKSDDSRYRSRLLVSLLILVLFVVLLQSLNTFLKGSHEIYLFVLFRLVGLAACFILLKYKSWYHEVCYLFLGTLAISQIFVIANTGGIKSPLLIWAFVTFGMSFALFDRLKGTIAVILYIALLFLCSAYDFLPDFQPFYSLNDLNTVNEFRWMSFVLAAIVATLIFIFYDKKQAALIRMEVKAREAKQNMIAVLCHDIVNPMNVIQGWAEMGKDPETTELAIEKIESASDTVFEIISSIRDLQALESGKTEINYKEIDINEIINHSRFIFDDKLKTKNLTLNFESDPGINLNVKTDKTIFSNNIFNNLISNAIKFSEAGSTIDISFRADEDGRYLSIKDQGIGIPQDILNNLFRADVATSRNGTKGEKGTGFGMPLVKSCIDGLGLKILVRSKDISEFPDQHGSEFIIIFPA